MTLEFAVPAECTDGDTLDVFIECLSLDNPKEFDVVNICTKTNPAGKVIKSLTIPSEYKGYKIPTISSNVFESVLDHLPKNNVPTGREERYTVAHKENSIPIEKLIISDGITEINSKAFYDKDIKEIRWPSTCDTIKCRTFEYCNVTSVTNLKNVKAIEYQAFSNCKHLEYIDYLQSCESIEREAFAFCHRLKRFDWPEKCETIPNYCFSGGVNLKEVNGLNVVKKIGEGAFCNIAAEELTLYDNCTEIGRNCFASSSLKKVKWNNACSVIPSRCFYYCNSLEEISGIENVTRICESAFTNTKLKSFDWPAGCTVIPSNCFESTDSLKTININSLIEEIRNYAFRGTSLESIDLRDSFNVTFWRDCLPPKTKVIKSFYIE